MKWVITEHVHYDRVAAPWLIKRFVDPAAQFFFAARGLSVDQLPEEQKDAIPLAVPGAKLSAHDENGPLFVKVVREYNLTSDPALEIMGKVITLGVEAAIHGFRPAIDDTYGQIAMGLLALHDGMNVMEQSDQKRLDMGLPIWDAVYALFKANKQRV